MKNIYLKISQFGIKEEMDSFLKRKIIFTNKLSLILALYFLLVAVVMLIKLNLFIVFAILLIFVFTLFSIPFFNKKGFTNCSRIILSLILPFFITLTSLAIKQHYEIGKEIIFYFLPRTAMVILSIIPMLILDFRKKAQFYLPLVFYAFCILIYSKLHDYFDIGIENAILSGDTYFLATIIPFLGFLVFTFAFIFVLRMNYFNEQNLLLKSKELKESEEYFKALIENISESISVLDAKANNIYKSESFNKIMGYTEEERVGKNIFDFIYKDDKNRLKQQFFNLIKKHEEVERLVFRAYHKDGTIRHIEGYGKNMLKSSVVKGVILNYRDETEQKENEKEIKNQNIQLKKLNATKDKFFSIIAHDLKNPFNAILGLSSLLNENFDEFDIEEQKEYINIIYKSAENTFKLLQNLLLWSQSQSGLIEFNPKKENLYLLTYEILDLLNQTANNKSIKIINNVPKDIIVKADKDMLATIIRNLISNAIKFTPKGGVVEIGCVETNHDLSLPTEIYVKDTGIGIKKENQAKLFKIEENISTEGTENESGTGLGLILCKEFVEKHGGEIWVESEIGKGSRFIFTIINI